MSSDLDFDAGVTVFRDRRPGVPGPYNPARMVPGEWANSVTITLDDVFVASSTSVLRRDATRMQVMTEKSLYATDEDVDVLPGDRIRVGGTAEDKDSGTPYMVPARPAADRNPWTGDVLVVEIPLERVEG